jgi:hypothetical protein
VACSPSAFNSNVNFINFNSPSVSKSHRGLGLLHNSNQSPCKSVYNILSLVTLRVPHIDIGWGLRPFGANFRKVIGKVIQMSCPSSNTNRDIPNGVVLCNIITILILILTVIMCLELTDRVD